MEAERKAVRNGDRNFKGIGLKGGEMSEKKTQSGIHVKLIGQDGNIFNLIGIVLRALRRNGRSDLCEPFKQAVTSSHSYQEALAKIMEFIIVE